MRAQEEEEERQRNGAVPVSERPRYYRPNCMLRVIESQSVQQLSRYEGERYWVFDRALRCSLVHLKVTNGMPSFFALEDDPYRLHLWLRNLESREVAADVARSLCPHNAILLCVADFSTVSLTTLLSPSVDLFRWLKRLNMYIEMSSDHTASCEADCTLCWKVSDIDPASLPACERTSISMVDFMPAWTRFLHRVAASMSSRELELNLVCDVTDARAARTILQPLQDLRIAKCAIRLRGQPDAELKSIARQTVLHVTRPDQIPQGHLRFLDLPPELRRHILSFTDLTTPDQEVLWEPTSFQLKDSFLRKHHTWTGNPLCSRVHATFPLCECWEPPTSLFLVCHTMLQDARAVFYSSNRFIILKQSYHEGESCCTNGFEATTFFKTMPQDALHYLRDLEIVFQPTGYSSTIQPQVLEDWKCSIKYAAQYLRKLNLAMIFGEERYPDLFDVPDESRASLEDHLSMQQKIVQPIAQLDCLESFHVEVALDSVYNYHPPRDLGPDERRQEECLRNMISTSSRGRAGSAHQKRKPSQWTYDRDPQCPR